MLITKFSLARTTFSSTCSYQAESKQINVLEMLEVMLMNLFHVTGLFLKDVYLKERR